jgi:urease accessory protein
MSGAADLKLALVRLLQLASPALPIGAYSYSQGLEWVIEQRQVHDAGSASIWIGDMLRLVVTPGEAAILWRLLGGVERGEWPEVMEWNDYFRASRETAELRAETEQMGGSMLRLASDLCFLDDTAREAARAMAPVMLPTAYAIAASSFGVDPSDALAGYVWSWLENQVLCVVKTIPLGQLAGQRLLLDLGAQIPAATSIARSIADADISTFAPGLAIASSRHETQYTRLYRS